MISMQTTVSQAKLFKSTVSQAKLFKSTLLQTCSTYYMCEVYIVPNQPLEAYSPLCPLQASTSTDTSSSTSWTSSSSPACMARSLHTHSPPCKLQCLKQNLQTYSPLNPSILSPLMCPTYSSSSKPSKLQPYNAKQHPSNLQLASPSAGLSLCRQFTSCMIFSIFHLHGQDISDRQLHANYSVSSKTLQIYSVSSKTLQIYTPSNMFHLLHVSSLHCPQPTP